MLFLLGFCLIHLIEICSESVEITSSYCKTKLAPGMTCYNLNIPDDIPSIEDRTEPFSNNSIFFIDATCDGVIDMHQACAVEAAAKANPDRDIYILFAGPVNTQCLATSASWNILKYDNVNIYRVKLKKYLEATPLESLLQYKQRSPVHRLADVLKYLTLYKFGGTYLDMNVLTVKSFDLLPEQNNWLGKIDSNTLSDGYLALSNHGIGLTLADAVLRQYLQCFKNNDWGVTSVDILTRALKTICETFDINMMGPVSCQGLHFYGSREFFLVNYETWRQFILTFKGHITLESPFAFFVWNYKPEQGHSDAEYLSAQLMDSICPLIRNISLEYSIMTSYNSTSTELMI